MKSIKHCLLLLLLLLIGSHGYGQLYFNLSAGCAIPVLKGLSGRKIIITETGYSNDPIYFSYGKGFTPAVNVGMNIGKYISAELGCAYLASAKNDFFTIYADPFESRITTFTRYARLTRILPGVRFTYGEKRMKLYNSIRFIIGIGSVIEDQLTSSITASGNNFYENRWKYYGGISSGVADALGVNYNMGRFGIFCEINFICQSWSPHKGKRLVSKKNGVDQMSTLPVSAKEMEFTTEVPVNTYNLNKPSQQLKEYWSLSSIGLQIGLSYSLSK